MTLLLTALLLGITLGLLAGLFPGIGNTVIILTLFPVLINWPSEIVILFYVVLIQSSNFTGSVSAINLGLLGDITSEPALRERNFIINNNLSLSALKYTAISSVVACMVAGSILVFLFDFISSSSAMLRSEVRFVIIWIISLAVLFWKNNKFGVNLLLLLSGIMLTLVGHYEFFLGWRDVHVLTFGQTFLHGGIPTISVLTCFLAIPALLKLYSSLKSKEFYTDQTNNTVVTVDVKYNWSSGIRGTLIGSFFGVVPMIGSMISSNIAWITEKLFQRNDSSLSQKSIDRLVSAEAANNSANVTVLLPLLLFGLAIIPSELILLSIVETQGWTPSAIGWTLMGLSFYHWMFIFLAVSCLIGYLTCYTFVSTVTKLVKNNIKIICGLTIALIASSLMYSGWMTQNYSIYLLTFVLFFSIVVLYRRIDYMPLVVGFLLGDQLLSVTSVIYDL